MSINYIPEQKQEPEPCRLPLIARVVGLPETVALEVVLHRIAKIQEATKQLEAYNRGLH